MEELLELLLLTKPGKFKGRLKTIFWKQNYVFFLHHKEHRNWHGTSPKSNLEGCAQAKYRIPLQPASVRRLPGASAGSDFCPLESLTFVSVPRKTMAPAMGLIAPAPGILQSQMWDPLSQAFQPDTEFRIWHTRAPNPHLAPVRGTCFVPYLWHHGLNASTR